MMLNDPKTLQRIDEVFVFIASDANGEGVPAFQAGAVMLPLVCADKARVDSLRKMARANGEGKRQQDHAGPVLRPRRPGSDRMTQDEHRARHELLHQMFDELLADYLTCNRGKVPSMTTVMELVTWSHQQTIEPQTEPTGNIMDIAKGPWKNLPCGSKRRTTVSGQSVREYRYLTPVDNRSFDLHTVAWVG
jgi:hypothetical protein